MRERISRLGPRVVADGLILIEKPQLSHERNVEIVSTKLLRTEEVRLVDDTFERQFADLGHRRVDGGVDPLRSRGRGGGGGALHGFAVTVVG